VKRLIAALAVALLCAPGTWLRSTEGSSGDASVAATAIISAQAIAVPGWTVEGVWDLASSAPQFGGFSALLDLGETGFAMFSDRGWRIDLTAPGDPHVSARLHRVFADQTGHRLFFDIEAATRDPITGRIWLASENNHAIHRFTADGSADGRRAFSGMTAWGRNSGIEAMARLDDGRFIILPERADRGLIFASDPVEGGAPATFRITVPAKGYAITDAAALPDGRLMVLLRKVLSPLRDGWPPFASMIAIGTVPQAGGTFAPEAVLPLAGLLPPENYEGLALRPRADGTIEVWLIADDNLSIFQRTILAKLVFAP
jgi:hypothetical protein